MNLILTDTQCLAIETALKVASFCQPLPLKITGSAGSGKTVVIRQIQEEFAKAGRLLVALAPTNSAANNINGYTIAKFLGKRPYYNDRGKLKFRLTGQVNDIKEMIDNGCYAIVDESWMIPQDDVFLLLDIFDNHVIFVGDNNQLPPIEEDRSITESILDSLTDIQTVELAGSKRFEHDKFIYGLSNDILEAGNIDSLYNLANSIQPGKIRSLLNNENYVYLSYSNRECEYINSVFCNYNELDYLYKGQWLLSDRTDLNFEQYASERVIISRIEEIALPINPVTLKDEKILTVSLDNGSIYSVMSEEDKLFFNEQKEELLKRAKAKEKNLGYDWKMYYEAKEKFITPFYYHFRTIHKSQGNTLNSVAVNVEDIFSGSGTLEFKRRMLYTGITRTCDKLRRVVK